MTQDLMLQGKYAHGFDPVKIVDLRHTEIISFLFTQPDALVLGPTWTKVADTSALGFQIASNAAKSRSSADASEYEATLPSSADQWGMVQFSATAADGLGAGLGFGLRMSNSNLSKYRFVANLSGYEITRFVPGFTPLISTAAVTFTAGDKFMGEVRTVGSTVVITVYKNNVLINSVVDNTPLLTNGRFGLCNSSPFTVGGISYFEAGTL